VLQTIIDQTSISAAVDSPAVNLRYISNFNIQAVISNSSGLSSVNLLVQASNNATDWDTIGGGTIAITADDSYQVNVSNAGYRFVRARFTVGGGSFDANVTISGKERPF
jgi:hypothetical protein